MENTMLNLISFANLNLSINFHNTILRNPNCITIAQSYYRKKIEFYKLDARFGFSSFFFSNPNSQLDFSLRSSKFTHFLNPVIKISSADSQRKQSVFNQAYTNSNISQVRVIFSRPGLVWTQFEITNCLFSDINLQSSTKGAALCLELEANTVSISIAFTKFIGCTISTDETYGGAIYVHSDSASEISITFNHLLFDKCTANRGSSYYFRSENTQAQLYINDINITNNIDQPLFSYAAGISYLDNCYLKSYEYILYSQITSNDFRQFILMLINCNGILSNIQFTNIRSYPNSQTPMVSYDGNNKDNHQITLRNIGCFDVENGYVIYLNQVEPSCYLSCEIINCWGLGESYDKNQPITYIGNVFEQYTEGMNIRSPTGVFTLSNDFTYSDHFTLSLEFTSVPFTESGFFSESNSWFFPTTEVTVTSTTITTTTSSTTTSSATTSSITTSSSSSISQPANQNNSQDNSSRKAGMIAGITIAAVVVLVVIVFVVIFFTLRKPMCCVKTAYQPSDDDESIRELVFFSNK